jgi:hypothetical protein
MKHLTRAMALTVVLLSPAVGAAAQRDVPYVYQGTVQTVRAGSMDLITGVGLALRLVHMRTLPTTAVASEGAPVALSDLKRGDVVRADCRLTDAGLIADRIEIKRRSS